MMTSTRLNSLALSLAASLLFISLGLAQQNSSTTNEPAGTPISLHVSDENGENIPGAKVALNDRLLQLTDVNGNCSFAQIADGDMDCYEGTGVPADIELLNRKSDIQHGIDPLIVRALELLNSKARKE